MKKICNLLVISLLWVCMVLVPVPKETALAAGQSISGSYGGKNYTLYVPSSYEGSDQVPLMVMLHGCTQDASQFATGTKMNALSETEGFLVLYPEQNASANSNKCWNWFEVGHQTRGSGEPSIIAGMVGKVGAEYSVDSEKIFVGGLSAGAAMSVILGATYPDVFSGIAVGAGLEYKAATTMVSAFTAMSSGGPSPSTQGRLAYQAMGTQAKPLPVIVFHGTADYTVNSINGEQVISQWAVTNNLAHNGAETGWLDHQPTETEQKQVPGGKAYTVEKYKTADNKVLMEKVSIQNMGHAWSGGSAQGSYTDPAGPDASQMMWDFFQTQEENENQPPGEAPVTTATPKGGTYEESVTVSLNVNSAATTYYSVDGTIPDENASIYQTPLVITNDTVLKFFSINADGKREAVKQENYTIVENSDEGTEIESIGSEDGFVGKLVADGKGAGTIKVGDKGMYNTDTYRGILSFDATNLPRNFQTAKIRVYVKQLQGTVSSISLDMKIGVLGSSASIEQTDYQATVTAANIAQATIQQGTYLEFVIPSSYYQQMLTTNKVQFRLKANTTAGFNANFVELYGGEDINHQPVIVVQ